MPRSTKLLAGMMGKKASNDTPHPVTLLLRWMGGWVKALALNWRTRRGRNISAAATASASMPLRMALASPASAAAVTDYLDGFMARRQGKVTFIGKVMDPVADKLLNSSAFIMLAAHGWVPAWMVCIIIGRELAVTGLRSVSAGKGIDVSASRLGKLKTGFQVAAIIPLMIHYPFLGLDPQAIGQVLLYLALAFTVWSGVDYFIKFKRLV